MSVNNHDEQIIKGRRMMIGITVGLLITETIAISTDNFNALRLAIWFIPCFQIYQGADWARTLLSALMLLAAIAMLGSTVITLKEPIIASYCGGLSLFYGVAGWVVNFSPAIKTFVYDRNPRNHL